MKKIFYVAAAALMICACAKTGSYVYGTKAITGKAPAFEFNEPMTKTNLVYNGSTGLSFFWAANDKVAVFGSVGQNQQIPLTIQDVAGKQVKNATFTISKDFLLRKGTEYVAYCPATDDIFLTAKKVPFSYTGQVQETNSIESTSHLGAVDYMVSAPTTPTDDNVAEFTFSHKCCPVLIEVVNLPAGTYTTAALKASEENFSLDGTMDIFEGTMDTETYSDNIAVTLKGGFTVAEGGTLDAWIMAAPAQLAGLNLSIVLTPSEGNPLVFAVPAEKVKDFVAGKAYKFTHTITEELKAIDLGLSVKWANMNVGASKTADYGCHYAWGESVVKEKYNKSTYSYYPDGNSNKCTKYNPDDKLVKLQADDDTATKLLGSDWRMPTNSEWEELFANCTFTSEVLGKVNAFKATSNINGNFIYLPKNGKMSESTLNSQGSVCHYWTSEATKASGTQVRLSADHIQISLYGTAIKTSEVKSASRYQGLGVRAVTTK